MRIIHKIVVLIKSISLRCPDIRKETSTTNWFTRGQQHHNPYRIIIMYHLIRISRQTLTSCEHIIIRSWLLLQSVYTRTPSLILFFRVLIIKVVRRIIIRQDTRFVHGVRTNIVTTERGNQCLTFIHTKLHWCSVLERVIILRAG